MAATASRATGLDGESTREAEKKRRAETPPGTTTFSPFVDALSRKLRSIAFYISSAWSLFNDGSPTLTTSLAARSAESRGR